MNREDIICMAQEAGNGDEEWKIIAKQLHKHFPEELERFATLVASAEREACAKVADGWPDYDVQGLAEAIRARGQA